jgi:hypothetical protein
MKYVSMYRKYPMKENAKCFENNFMNTVPRA